jgi:hypothetical protein
LCVALPAKGSPLQYGDLYTISADRFQNSSDLQFWVKVAVKKSITPVHIKVRWTLNNWTSYEDADATYDGEENALYNRYIVKPRLGSVYDRRSYSVQFKAQVNGNWEPFANHVLDDGIFPGAPVRLLQDSVRGSNGNAVISGTVAAFPFETSNRSVTIFYSGDGWKTVQQVPARATDKKTFAFEMVLPGNKLPNELQYAVRYSVNQGESWANAGGFNYRHKLEPKPNFQTPNATLNPSDGGANLILGPTNISLRHNTDLPVETERCAVDNGEENQTPVEISPINLENGLHTIQCNVTYQGGIQRTYNLPFTTNVTIRPLEQWNAPIPQSLPAPTDSWEKNELTTMTTSGKFIYGIWDEVMLVRYPEFGSNREDQIYKLPENAKAKALAADGAGNLFVVAYEGCNVELIKYRPNGERDLSFGEYGIKPLQTEQCDYFYEYRDRTQYVAVSPNGENVTVILSQMSFRTSTNSAPIFRISAATGEILLKSDIQSILLNGATFARVLGLVDSGDRIFVTRKGTSILNPTTLKLESSLATSENSSHWSTRSFLTRDSRGVLWSAVERGLTAVRSDGLVQGRWISEGSTPSQPSLGYAESIISLSPAENGTVLVQAEVGDHFRGSHNTVYKFGF